MDLSDRLSVSYYEMIAPINERHKVYLVRHRETGRLFVKKILSIYSADIYRELRQHPVEGIPRIIAFCEEGGRLTVIEEFISGVTLRDKIELACQSSHSSGRYPGNAGTSDGSASGSPIASADGSLAGSAVGLSADSADGSSAGFSTYSADDTLTIYKIGRYMVQLCGILEQLHSLDPPIIHRDVKPSNIMITSYDNVILLDLNAARYYSGNPNQEADTKLLGTHGYAAPEQYGFRESSPQSDIFSVGRTLKEAVGTLPYEDHTFDAVIAKCTQMDPSKRYTSAAALKAALRKSLNRYERSNPQKNPERHDLYGIRSPGRNDRDNLYDQDLVVNPYLPPGFRTLNPRNMLIASVFYAAVTDICFTLKIDNAFGVSLWFQRICILVIFLADTLIANDYLGIQRFTPLHKSPNRFVRALGTVLMITAVTLALFILTLLVVGLFFAPH